jgi:hypothetical protein
MTPSGIETSTFQFVAQYLNHCATAVLQHVRIKYKVSAVLSVITDI